jgi:hypothetical protein
MGLAPNISPRLTFFYLGENLSLHAHEGDC